MWHFTAGAERDLTRHGVDLAFLVEPFSLSRAEPGVDRQPGQTMVQPLGCVGVRLAIRGRGVALLGVVVESEADGVVDGQGVEIGRVDEAGFGGFVADGDGADDAAGVGDVELLPDFAVGVGDDVVGVGVDAEQAGEFDVEAGIAPALAVTVSITTRPNAS